MQKKINDIVPEGYEMVDAGMYIPEGGETELWRDNVLEKDGKEFCYQFSTAGELKGDVPPELALTLPLLVQENGL